MSIRRWEPFSELVSLRDAMDRLFEEGLSRSSVWRGMSGLPVDMYQTDKDVVIKASLPGVKPENLDISVTGEVLTIKAEVKGEEKVEREDYFYQERRSGMFTRSLTLPVAVDADNAHARFEDGVLVLTLPKAEAAKAKKIEVQGPSSRGGGPIVEG